MLWKVTEILFVWFGLLGSVKVGWMCSEWVVIGHSSAKCRRGRL